MNKLRLAGWLLVGAGLLTVVTPLAMIGYGSWQESSLTQQWEAQLPAPADSTGAPTPIGSAAPGAQAPAQRVAEKSLIGVDFALRIPRLGYDAAVREGVSDSILSFGPGHYPTTPQPGQHGNVGVAAHNTYWLRFGEIKPGDRIVLQTRQNSYTYTVTGTKVVQANDRTVLTQGDGQHLTLTTCWPLWAGALAPQRLAIFGQISG